MIQGYNFRVQPPCCAGEYAATKAKSPLPLSFKAKNINLNHHSHCPIVTKNSWGNLSWIISANIFEVREIIAQVQGFYTVRVLQYKRSWAFPHKLLPFPSLRRAWRKKHRWPRRLTLLHKFPSSRAHDGGQQKTTKAIQLIQRASRDALLSSLGEGHAQAHSKYKWSLSISFIK